MIQWILGWTQIYLDGDFLGENRYRKKRVSRRRQKIKFDNKNISKKNKTLFWSRSSMPVHPIKLFFVLMFYGEAKTKDTNKIKYVQVKINCLIFLLETIVNISSDLCFGLNRLLSSLWQHKNIRGRMESSAFFRMSVITKTRTILSVTIVVGTHIIMKWGRQDNGFIIIIIILGSKFYSSLWKKKSEAWIRGKTETKK